MSTLIHEPHSPLRAPCLRAGWALALLALLAACSTPQTAPKATPYTAQDAASSTSPTAASGSFAWSPAMDDTSRRLRSALSGSGATVTQTTDQRLWLSLPVEAVFARGRAAVKPPGTTSLDQIALALRANNRAQAQIVGDADAAGAGGSALALDRAASARDWIVGRGVIASRLGVASRSARAPAGAAPRLDILIGERARGSSSGAD